MKAAIDTLKATTVGNGITPGNWEVVRILLWNWIDANADHEVTTIKVWFIRKKLYVRDLHGVFELILGKRPDYSAP